MMTEPATRKLAPSHHVPAIVRMSASSMIIYSVKSPPGKDSLKIIAPNIAVTMKFALVFITLTRTVLVARVRARVKRPHMTALNARFKRKKSYCACQQTLRTKLPVEILFVRL